MPDMFRATSGYALGGSRTDPKEFRLLEMEETELDDDTFDTIWLSARKSNLFRAFLREFVKRNVSVVTANGWPPGVATVGFAVKTLASEVKAGIPAGASPAWILVACSENLDPAEVLEAVQAAFPKTLNVHCITSCQGVTTEVGFKSTTCDDGATRALSMLCVFDPLGTYATVGVLPVDSPQSVPAFEERLDWAYMQLRKGALDIMKDPDVGASGVPGPEPLALNLVIWMSGLPGTEEGVLEALYEWGHQRFNRTVPVVGGTGADAEIAGKWRAYCQQVDGTPAIFGQERGNGVVLTLIASSVKVFPCYMHPFTPMSEFAAKVVSCGSTEEAKGEASGRVIQYVKDSDGNVRAAGSLYHQWCEEHIEKRLMPRPLTADGPGAFNKAVLAASTRCPLGISVGRDGDDAYDYRMMHPSGIYWFKGHEQAQKDAYLKCFASVDAGKSDIVLFKASRGDLLNRLSKLKDQLVTQIDRSSGGSSKDAAALSADALRARLSGVAMVYCAGCMMGLSSGRDGAEQMRRLTATLSSCFGGRPFMAYHPFGEQGFFPSKQVNHHSNLMFSALAFSKDPCLEIDESRSFVDMLMPVLKKYKGDSESNVVRVLLELLVHGEEANFDNVANIVSMGYITPVLLQELTPCAARPLNFALNTAQMFHQMARLYPLKANQYAEASRWFKQFCRDFIHVAPMLLLHKGGVLDYATIRQAVLMAVKIDSKGLVASSHFQEVVDKVWQGSPDPEEAIRKLVGDEGVEERTCAPMTRYYSNLLSYTLMTVLQVYTSRHASHSSTLWAVILLWSTSHMIQTMASPATGFYSYTTVADDVILVLSHAYIFWQVLCGGDTPRDLDAITMLLHFGNILKGLIVQHRLGPHIIMVVTMMGDIQQLLILLFFFLLCFYCSLNALFRDVTAEYVGEDWADPSTLLINVIWGPQVLWSSVDRQSDDRNLFLSFVTGGTDSGSINTIGAGIVAAAVFTIPILLLNLLVAMMTTSYSSVSLDVDAEYKRSFASCVLVARELPVLPIPFCAHMDLWRLFAKHMPTFSACRQCRLNGASAPQLLSQEAIAKRQLATSQIVALWEAQAAIDYYKTSVTVDQVERVRNQNDGLQDKMNLLYSVTMNLGERIGRFEDSLASLKALNLGDRLDEFEQHLVSRKGKKKKRRAEDQTCTGTE